MPKGPLSGAKEHVVVFHVRVRNLVDPIRGVFIFLPFACHAVRQGRRGEAGSQCWLRRCCPDWEGPSPGSPVVSACRSACCSDAGFSSAISEWNRRLY